MKQKVEWFSVFLVKNHTFAFFKYILLILYFKKTHYNTIIWKVKYIFNCYLAGIFLNKYYCVWAWLAHFSWPATGLADFFLRPTVHSAYCTLYKNILFDGGGKITSCFPPHYLQYPHFLFNKENIKLDEEKNFSLKNLVENMLRAGEYFLCCKH